MDELLLLNRTNTDFCRATAIRFPETWLSEHIPDSSLYLLGFQILSVFRITELSVKARGGGIWFYINGGWCTNFTLLNKTCSPRIQTIFINCKPFYSPQEFNSFILVGIYIPLQTCVSEILSHRNMEHKHPDSLPTVLGDFNRANLS